MRPSPGSNSNANGSPSPEFETDDERSYFLTRLPVHDKAADWVSRAQTTPHVYPARFRATAQETTQEKIVRLLRDRPQFTRLELAAELGLTPDSVKYHLTNLRKAGRIRHTGPTKAGRWEVLQ